jgi:5-methyltetrahydrofolate--homocysteine methyltransferase
MDGKTRGKEFASHPSPLVGCNDLLCLTRPEIIISIHEAYLKSGADIISTCSFNATSVSLADYGLGERAYDISRAAGEAALSRKAAAGRKTAFGKIVSFGVKTARRNGYVMRY